MKKSAFYTTLSLILMFVAFMAVTSLPKRGSGPAVPVLSALAPAERPAFAASGQKPVVYMTADISPEGLLAVYEALGRRAEGKVAVKISTGEPPASNYLRPELIGKFVQQVKGSIVESCTAVGGRRSNATVHYQTFGKL